MHHFSMRQSSHIQTLRTTILRSRCGSSRRARAHCNCGFRSGGWTALGTFSGSLSDASVVSTKNKSGGSLSPSSGDGYRVNDTRIAENILRVSVARFLRRGVRPAVALLACGVAIFLLHRLFREIDYRSVMRAARETAPKAILISFLFTTMSYLALVGRDRCALFYIGVKVPHSPSMLASFCGSATDNAIGFGVLTGKAIRDRVYGAVGLGSEQIDRITLFNEMGFAIGLVSFAALSAMLAGSKVARWFSISTSALEFTAGAALIVILALAGNAIRGRKKVLVSGLLMPMPQPGIALSQLLLTILDLFGATASLWFLLPASYDFFSLGLVYSASIALATISQVPGGFAVFDAIVFLSLAGSMPRNNLAAALLIFRGIYYLLPLMIATASIAFFELKRDPLVSSSMRPRGHFLLGADLIAPVLLSVLTFSVGVMLILSG
jgi:phosphatidylglycerol lysyltransferase